MGNQTTKDYRLFHIIAFYTTTPTHKNNTLIERKGTYVRVPWGQMDGLSLDLVTLAIESIKETTLKVLPELNPITETIWEDNNTFVLVTYLRYESNIQKRKLQKLLGGRGEKAANLGFCHSKAERKIIIDGLNSENLYRTASLVESFVDRGFAKK